MAIHDRGLRSAVWPRWVAIVVVLVIAIVGVAFGVVDV